MCDEDGTGLLVCSVIKASELVPSTSANVRNRARYLEAQSITVTGQDFVELQQAVGMTHHPMSILLDRSLDDKK